MADFELIWARIKGCAGAVFHTAQGLPFTYHLPGEYLVVNRDGRDINRSLSKTNFRPATEQMPVPGPAGLGGLQGTSYTWAILSDERIRPSAW